MSGQIRSREKGLKALRNKTVRGINSAAWLGVMAVLLLVGSFLLYNFAAHAQEGEIGFVQFVSRDCPNKFLAFEGTSFSINGKQVKISEGGSSATVQFVLGSNTVSGLSMPKYPDAKLVSIKVETYRATWIVDASSGSATFQLGTDDFWPEVRPKITISTANDCPGQEKQESEEKPRTVKLLVYPNDCDRPDYEKSSIIIGDQGARIDKDGRSLDDIEIKPGATYQVSLSSLKFPVAKVDRVIVYRHFGSRGAQRIGQLDPDASGTVNLRLVDALWGNEASVFLAIGVTGLCREPKTGQPPDFGMVTAIAVSGKVELVIPPPENASAPVGRTTSREGVYEDPKTYRFDVPVGWRLFRGAVIETGEDGILKLKSEYGHVITITEKTRVLLGPLMTASGRAGDYLIKKGRILFESKESSAEGNVSPPPSQSTGNDIPAPSFRDYQREPPSINTPNLEAMPGGTDYSVSYDESTNVTTVGVDEGRVNVTPVNASLKPFTLEANQQVQVTDSSVSAITAYSGPGGQTGRVLLYVGIALASLLALGTLIFFLRRQPRLAMQPAFHPAIANPAGPIVAPAQVAPPVVSGGSHTCPSPQCGKTVAATKKFCPHCGTDLKASGLALAAGVKPPVVEGAPKRCPNQQCGKEALIGKRFCAHCGTSLNT